MKAAKLILIIVLFFFIKNTYSQCVADFTYTVDCLTVTFTDASDPDGSTITNWDWVFNGGSPTTSTQPNPTATFAVGTHNVSLQIVTAASCTDNITIPVTIHPQPTASITDWTVDLSACPNTIDFTGTVNNETTYEWDFTGGTNTTSLTPFYAYPYNPPAGVPETYNVTLTAFTDIGVFYCEEESTPVTVTIYPDLAPDFTMGLYTSGQCSNDSIHFTNTTEGGTANNTYLWDFGDGSSNSTLEDPVHKFNAYGDATETYTIRLTVTNPDNGCETFIEKNVTLTERPDARLFEINLLPPPDNTTISNCDNASSGSPAFTIIVSDNPTVPTINTGYKLKTGTTVIYEDYSTPPVPPMNVSYTYISLGIYELTYIVYVANDYCNDTTIYTVLNIGNPGIGLGSPANTSDCAPFDVTFPIYDYQDNDASTTYTLCFGDDNCVHFTHPPPTSYTHTYTTTSCDLPSGSFQVSIEATNQCKSTSFSGGAIVVQIPPEPNFQPDDLFGCVNTEMTFTNNTLPAYGTNCTEAVYMQWDFGEGPEPPFWHLSYPYPNATHTYALPGVYTVTLKLWNTCVGDDPPPNNSWVTYQFNVCIEANDPADFTLGVPNPSNSCIPVAVGVANNSDPIKWCDNNTYTWDISNFDDGDCASSTGDDTWDFETGDASSIAPEFRFIEAGAYTIEMRLDNACVTNSIHEEVIIVKGPPVLTGIENIEDGCVIHTISPNAQYEDCYSTVDPLTDFTWIFTGGIGGDLTENPPGEITYSTAGTYNITVEAENICGVSNLLVEPVVISPEIENNTITCPGSICQGQNPPLIDGTEPPVLIGGDGTTYTYLWHMCSDPTFPVGVFTVEGGDTPDLLLGSPLTTDMWFRRIVNSGGASCADTSLPCMITVIPGILNNTIASDQNKCFGDPPDFIDHSGLPLSGGSGIYSYEWFEDSGFGWNPVAPPATDASYQPPASLSVGVYEYRRVVNSIPQDDCDSESNIVIITVYERPSIDSPVADLICNGVPVNYSPTSTIPGTTFSWEAQDNSGGVIAGITPGTNNTTIPIPDNLSNASTTTETVTYWITPTYDYGSVICDGDVFEYIVSVNPEITISLNAVPTSVPFGGSTTITATVTGGTGAYNYNWSGDILNDLGTSIVSNSLFVNTLFTLVITDDNDCPLTESILITVGGAPTLTVSANPTIICPEELSTLTALAQGGSGGFSYEWDISGVPFGGNTSQVDVNPSNTTVYTITVDDGINPTISADVTVEVTQPPVITSDLAVEICSGTTLSSEYNIESDIVGITTYAWSSHSFDPGCIAEYGGTGSGQIDVILENTCLTPQTITYTITPTGPDPPTNGCTGNSVDLVVTVNPVAHIVNTPNSQIIASGGTPIPLPLTPANSDVSPVLFEWTTLGNSELSAYNSPSSGTGGLIFTSISITGSNEVESLDFTIIPVFQGVGINCPGEPFTYTIYIQQTPPLHTVSGGGAFCDDGINCVDIILESSTNLMKYQLKKGTENVGNPKDGDGGALTWACIYETGVYKVLATNPNTGAEILMEGDATVTPQPIPDLYTLKPDQDDICVPFTPYLGGWQDDVTYTLWRGTTNLGDFTGTSGQTFLTFPQQTTSGIYSVTASLSYDPDLVCPRDMLHEINALPQPEEFNIEPNDVLCAGDTISIDGSQLGFLYCIYDLSSKAGCYSGSSTVIGTGSEIELGVITEAGDYTVKAVDPVTGCWIIFSETITVNPTPLVMTQTPVQGCECDLITLTDSEEGIGYELILEEPPGSYSTEQTIYASPPFDDIDFTETCNVGTYFIVATNLTTFCSDTMLGTTIIRPSPQVYTLKPGGGGDCPDIPRSVWLDQWENNPNIDYILLKNGVAVPGAVLNGTSTSILFDNLTAVGVYTIRAVYNYPGTPPLECWSDMDGQYEIYPLPDIYTLYPTGPLCAPATLYLNHSDVGVEYTLHSNTNFYGPFTGVDGTLFFPNNYPAETYWVTAVSDPPYGCTSMMSGVVEILPNPEDYNLNPSGPVCELPQIEILGSEEGVTYRLFYEVSLGSGKTEIPPAIIGQPGWSSVIFTGPFTNPGIYSVEAESPTNPVCETVFSDIITLEGVQTYTLYHDEPACPGITIGINASEDGILYKLMKSDGSQFGSTKTGNINGDPVFWDNVPAGIYTIVALTPALGCEVDMNGSCTINPNPIAYDITPAGPYCEDNLPLIGMQNSESGVNYYLFRKNSTDTIASKKSPGGLFTFTITNPPLILGKYYVTAIDTISECPSEMTDTVTILANPEIYNINPDAGTYCNPTTIGLDQQEEGVVYKLMYNGHIETYTGVAGGGPFTFNSGYLYSGTDYQYTVEATITVNGYSCPSEMLGAIIIDPGPEIFNLSALPDEFYCEGTSGVTLQLDDSEPNVEYQLKDNSGGDVQASQTGTGGTLDWFNIMAGAYHVVATYSGDPLCTAVMNNYVTVSVQPLPEATAPATYDLCEGVQTQVLGSTTSFNSSLDWEVVSPGSGSFVDNSVLEPFFTPDPVSAVTTYQLKLTAYGDGECTGEEFESFVTVTVQPKPEITAPSPLTMCEQTAYSFSGFNEIPVNFQSGVLWEVVPADAGYFDNAGDLLTNFTAYDVSVVTTIQLVLTAYGETPCDGESVSEVISVTIEPLPEVEAGSDATICYNEPYQVNDATVNAYSNLNWLFNPLEVSIVGQGTLNPIFTPVNNTTGLVTITLEATGTPACASTPALDSKHIFINAIPIAGFDFQDTCTNQIKFFDSSSPIGALIDTWEWNFDDGNGSSEQNPTYIYANVDCYDVQLIVTDLKFCTDTIVHEVCLEPELWVDFAYDTVCVGDTTHFYGILIEPLDAQIDEWQWEFGDTQTGYGDTTWHIYSNPGTYYVLLTATDDNDCVSTEIHTVEVYPLPEVSFTAEPIPDQLGFNFFFTPQLSPDIDTLTWYFGDDSILEISGAGDYEYPQLHIYDGSGEYEVSLTVVNENGCDSTYTLTVVRDPLVNAGFVVVEDTLCSYHVISFIDSSFSQEYIVNWSWDFGDGSPLEEYITYQDTVTHVFEQADEYIVTLEIESLILGETFTNTYSETVVVQASPIAAFSWDGICDGETTQFTNESNPNGGSNIAFWNWDFGDGSEDNVPNPTNTFADTGSYNVELIVESTIGCHDTMQSEFRLYALPEVGFSTNVPCITRSTLFYDESVANYGDIESAFWQFDYEGINVELTGESASYVFNSTGNYPFNLSVIDEHGCSNSGDFEIDVFTIPTSEFSMIYNYDNIQGQVKFENLSEGASDYLWDFDWDYEYNSTEENPIYSYPADGEYVIQLIASNSDFCTDTTFKIYNLVFSGLYVPTAFSPADPDPGLNTFLPKGIGLKNYNIQVFDIWGTMVWSSSAITLDGQPEGPGWDGTYKGKELPTGGYVWKASAEFIDGTLWKGSDIGDGKQPQTQGSLMLIR